ncbi:MAG: DUF6483 family protein [Anaerolineales bacterium]
MLTEDYFLRMINQMLVVLTQILYHKDAGQYQEAQILIEQSLEQLLGVRPGLLKQMDDDSVLRLLTSQGELDPDRLAMVAELYKLEGDLLVAQNVNPEADNLYLRSLTFYLQISLNGNPQGLISLDDKIDELYQKFSDRDVPEEVLYLLFDYYEERGDYARVEQQISGLLKKDDHLPVILPGIIAYYGALLEKSDQDLAAGGISRALIQAGLDKTTKLLK